MQNSPVVRILKWHLTKKHNKKSNIENRKQKNEKNISFSFFLFFGLVEAGAAAALLLFEFELYSLTTDPGRALDIKLAPIAPIKRK